MNRFNKANDLLLGDRGACVKTDADSTVIGDWQMEKFWSYVFVVVAVSL